MALFEDILKKKAKENSVSYALVQGIIKLQKTLEGRETDIKENRLKKIDKLVTEIKKWFLKG